MESIDNLVNNMIIKTEKNDEEIKYDMTSSSNK